MPIFRALKASNDIKIKLRVPSGKCQRGEFVYLLWNVPIQIFAIFFKMDSAIEKDGSQLQNNNFGTL